MTAPCAWKCAGMSWLGPCPEPAVVIATAACVHEHVRTNGLCRTHRAARDQAACGVCYEADGHWCDLAGWKFTPLPAATP